MVTEDTGGEQFIIECKGNLMLESKFKEDNPLPKYVVYSRCCTVALILNLCSWNDIVYIKCLKFQSSGIQALWRLNIYM